MGGGGRSMDGWWGERGYLFGALGRHQRVAEVAATVGLSWTARGRDWAMGRCGAQPERNAGTGAVRSARQLTPATQWTVELMEKSDRGDPKAGKQQHIRTAAEQRAAPRVDRVTTSIC